MIDVSDVKSFADAQALYKKMRDLRKEVEEDLTLVSQKCSELWSAETGIKIGTHLIWHNYKASYRKPAEDRECIVSLISSSTFTRDGTPNFKVVLVTKDGKRGIKHKDMYNARWSLKT